MSDQKGSATTEDLVLSVVRRTEHAARFVTEIVREVGRGRDPAEAAEVEAALSRLESAGAILVRDHYCADPHLDGVDLRIAGAVLARADEDASSACIRDIEAVWQGWITDYLMEHRCS